MARSTHSPPASSRSITERSQRSVADASRDRPSTIVDQPPVTILVLGQTPPPYGGQAMMINRLVRARFSKIRIRHVRMAFSSSMREVGTFAGSKLVHLVATMCRALIARAKYHAKLLYFPPAGPSTNPVLRDIALLLVLRPFFEKTVFHFRAAGVSEFVASRSRVF